jgi:site-specific DNA-methyltransferase (adenine-specific)|tara:strand:+ start:410 stop:1150 length:741 start_codon:yes stop_codon:yes gene_type:complete
MIDLRRGNCMDILQEIPDNSVDMVCVDLPYGTTACKWDSILPLDELWKEYNRICKENGAMVLTAAQPFTTVLAHSNLKNFRYSLVWEKPNGTNPFQASIMPMKKHEDILVFYRKAPTYNPQMEKGKPYKWNSNRSGGEAGSITQNKETPIDNTGTRYPSSVLRFKQERGLHPTQKPVDLMEWLIRSYTNEGEVVLDNTMGSGTTGVACRNCGRSFIGIEMNDEYFNMAKDRIESVTNLELILEEEG